VDTVGVRELRAHLSRYLEHVRSGARLVVTDRGRAIATISPADASPPAELEWAARWVAEGRGTCSGGKPRGASRRILLTKGRSVADAVLEDRR
jgi:prevent-host-death family protein